MSDLVSESPDASPLDPEDVARANLYGLISRFFYAPADANLLAEISHSSEDGEGEDDRGLNATWRGLKEACRNAFPPVVRQEYDTLFVGVGKSQVTPYLSGYAEPTSPDRFLVRLRGQLSEWGLGRRESVFEVEDHISGVSDAMRWLIENRHPLVDQRQFFENFVYPGAIVFCAAVQNAPSSSFYKPVSALVMSFLEIEKAAFDISDKP